MAVTWRSESRSLTTRITSEFPVPLHAVIAAAAAMSSGAVSAESLMNGVYSMFFT